MYSQSVTIINKSGLHARPAADFVALAKRYKSAIKICRQDSTAEKGNAKSIISLLSLGLTKGTQIVLEAEGEDEKQAIEELCKLIDAGCGEE